MLKIDINEPDSPVARQYEIETIPFFEIYDEEHLMGTVDAEGRHFNLVLDQVGWRQLRLVGVLAGGERELIQRLEIQVKAMDADGDSISELLHVSVDSPCPAKSSLALTFLTRQLLCPCMQLEQVSSTKSQDVVKEHSLSNWR